MSSLSLLIFCLFFNDTATTEIYTLSLHDALPISSSMSRKTMVKARCALCGAKDMSRSEEHTSELQSHSFISYAGFCLKKNYDGAAPARSRPSVCFDAASVSSPCS